MQDLVGQLGRAPVVPAQLLHPVLEVRGGRVGLTAQHSVVLHVHRPRVQPRRHLLLDDHGGVARLAQRLVHLQREEVGGESWGNSLCSSLSCALFTFARFASNSLGFNGFRS